MSGINYRLPTLVSFGRRKAQGLSFDQRVDLEMYYRDCDRDIATRIVKKQEKIYRDAVYRAKLNKLETGGHGDL